GSSFVIDAGWRCMHATILSPSLTPGARMTRCSRIVASWTACLFCAFCASSVSERPCAVACALPLALSVTVTSSTTGGPIAGAYVSGDPYGAGEGNCDQAPGSTCYLHGFAGEYTLQIGAPGFHSLERTITVALGTGIRSCPGTIAGHLDVSLDPTPSAAEPPYPRSSRRASPAASVARPYAGPMRRRRLTCA